MCKTICYSPGLLLEIGRFRLIGNSSQIFTNKAVLSYKSICTHVVVVSTEFGVSVQNLPKSAMFKTMGYCPGFLLKNGHCQTLANSPGVDTNSPAMSWKFFCKHLGAFQAVWNDFQDLPKSAMSKTMGYSPGLLLEIGRFRLIGNSSQIFTNKAVLSYKSICAHVVVVSTEFGVSVQNLPKSAMFKTMGYWPGFLLKNGHCPTLANSPGINTNSPAMTWKFFCKHLEAFQAVWNNFQDLPKSAMSKTMDYSPGFLLKNGQFSNLAISPEID